MLLKFPTAGLANNGIPIRLHVDGNVDIIDLVWSTGNNMRLNAYRGSILVDQTANTTWTDYITENQEFFISIELAQNGANLDTGVLIIREDGEAGVPTEQLTAVTVTRVNQVIIGAAGTDMDGSSVGQIVVGNDTGAFNSYINGNDYARGTTGFLREPADVRISRLFTQVGVAVTATGPEGDSPLMGTEGDGKLGELVQAAVDVDMGLLMGDRSTLGVEYKTLASLYGQASVLTLSYADSHLSRGLTPTRSDLGVANDVSVSRPGGGSARYVIPDDDPWHWTTQDPPDGAGVRSPTSPSLNVLEDEQLNELAAWIAHTSSWREKRIPVVPLNLSRDAFSADDIAAVKALDLGSVFAINTTGMPRYLPYNEVRLMVQGYEEFINKIIHTIAFNTTQADIYEVDVVTSGPTSTLVAPIDDNDVSVKVAPGTGAPWYAPGTSYHIQIAGQPMTVTAASTDTPAHIASGAVSYADNAAVTPALPAGMTPDTGQLMVAFIFRRATGAGIIGAAPTGWSEILRSPDNNWVLGGRYYATGDAAVQWTVSGGAAGDTVGGVVMGFSGLSMTLDQNARAGYPDGYERSVNASAQNIAYPAYLPRRTRTGVFLIGQKDDDWTSVALELGTELIDSSSLTGSDIGVVIDFYNPGTATLVPADSFAVTGGASAVSEGIVVGLRPLQTLTVTRGIAGVATSAAVGATVNAWRPGVNGL
jgi:hypothetical protein